MKINNFIKSISVSNKLRQTNAGQAVIIAIVLFTFGSLIFIGGVATPALSDVKEANNLLSSKRSFFTSEASVEDVVYRVKNALYFSTSETLTLDGFTATTDVVDTANGKSIIAQGDVSNLIRKSQVDVVEGIGAAFFYGIQSGTGGIVMQNFSKVRGNVYSNGTIVGHNSNVIKGDAISAGPSGLIDGIHATGTAHANVIQNSEVDGDAYYQTISNTVVLGTEYTGSTDQVPVDLPITDAMVDLWKATAETGGVISSPCPYKIESSMTLGPVKIECDLVIDKNSTIVTLLGPVWVTGNINTKSGPTIQIDPSLGKESVPIIADNPSDNLTSARITLENDSLFVGSGTPGSYVLLLSQNNSAESGGSTSAIEVKNSAQGDLFVYAGHGEIELENNISLKEVTAFRIKLENNAEVIYESGFSSLLFTSGPGGGFEIDSWKEVE